MQVDEFARGGPGGSPKRDIKRGPPQNRSKKLEFNILLTTPFCLEGTRGFCVLAPFLAKPRSYVGPLLRARVIKKQARVMRTCVKVCVIAAQPNIESNHRTNEASESPRQ